MASIDLRVTGREILFFGLLGTLLGLSGCGSLIFDTRFRSDAAVKSDLNSGADANQTTGFGLTPLYWAVNKGRVNVVKLLLAHGANVNQATRLGTTPLMEAAIMDR